MKSLILLLLIYCNIFSAVRTWNSSGSTDANNGDNYTVTGSLSSEDTLILDGTSVIDWIMTDSLSVASIQVDPAYTGNWSMGGNKLTTVGRLFLNGTEGAWTMNAPYTMTGNGYFYIGNFGSFSGAGCHVTLDGMSDTLSFTKSLGDRSNYFRGFSMCKDSGSRAYVLHTAGAVMTHNWTIGLGYFTRNGSGFMGIDPDTAYPLNFARSGRTWDSNAFNGGGAIWRTDTSVKTIYIGYLRIGGSISFPIISSFNDTVVFTDSATSPGFRWSNTGINCTTVVIMRTPLFFCYGGAMLFTADSTSTYIFNWGSGWRYGIAAVNAFSIPTLRSCIYNMDTASVVLPSWYNPSLTFKDFSMRPGLSTVKYKGLDSLFGSSNFNAFVCSTTTKINIVDSLIANTVVREHGKLFVPGTIKTRTFIDTASDTCKLSNLYITGDATFSSASTLLWYPNSKIYVQGTAPQTITTNGKRMPKIIVSKGSKVKVK